MESIPLIFIIAADRSVPRPSPTAREELQRLSTALDRRREAHPWPVAAIRLLTLNSARLSEALILRWEEIGEQSEEGAGARLGDSKTGPRAAPLGAATLEHRGAARRAGTGRVPVSALRRETRTNSVD